MDEIFNSGLTSGFYTNSMGKPRANPYPKIRYQNLSGFNNACSGQFSTELMEYSPSIGAIEAASVHAPNNAISISVKPANGVDLCPSSEKLTCWCNLPLNYLDCSAANQTVNYFEPVAYWATPMGPYAVSGAYLERVEDAYNNLAALETVQVRTLESWFASVQYETGSENVATVVDPSFFNIECTLQLIDEVNLSKQYSFAIAQSFQLFHALIQLARTEYLKSRLSRKMRAARKALHQTLARYCGLSWSRRLWSLLHGSHPPKPETWFFDCQEFGCA